MLKYEELRTLVILSIPVFFIIDTVQMKIIIDRDIEMEYWYALFHKKRGLGITSFLKIISFVMIIYFFYYPVIQQYDAIMFSLYYFFLVLFTSFKLFVHRS